MDGDDLPPIRLIDFANLKTRSSFPRYPDNEDITINLDDLSPEERANSVIIFISHCWLRGWNGAEGWDGKYCICLYCYYNKIVSKIEILILLSVGLILIIRVIINSH